MNLEELLASRDARVAHQAQLLGEYPGKTLLCLTVMLPGSVKRSEVSLKIATAAVEAVRSGFSPLFEELRDLETGYEGYFMVDLSPVEAKLAAVALEDSHPLGRLFDLDVVVLKNSPFLRMNFGPFFEDGTVLIPLGRQELGLPQRLCLLCGKPVRECMRTRAHTTEELLNKINEICTSTNSLETPGS